MFLSRSFLSSMMICFLPLSSTTASELDQLDPFSLMDGVSSIHYSPSNSTSQAFGYFNIPAGIPMTVDAEIPIGSNSKLYTAVAIYQLHEQGLLDVDADIATMLDEKDFLNFGITGVTKYCPQVGFNGNHQECNVITLRQMLGMSSGMYPSMNCDEIASTPTQCDRTPYFINPGTVGLVVGSFILEPLLFEPGTQYQYSNPNFVLATYFVEKYSDMTFQKYLETNIFSKIGLNHTSFDHFNGQLEINTKRPMQYFKTYDNVTYKLLSVGAAPEFDLGAVAGAGGFLSTVEDHATFWYTLFNKDTKGAPLLTNPSSLDAILTPQTPTAVEDGYYVYFGQGIVIACTAEGCPDGPELITYTGGTLTCSTANMLNYSSSILSQVWTTTQLMTTSAEAFEETQNSQTGTLIDLMQAWKAPLEFDATKRAREQLDAATNATGGEGNRKLNDSASLEAKTEVSVSAAFQTATLTFGVVFSGIIFFVSS